MPAGKTWSEYNEHLVRRGEFYLSLDFLDLWNVELEEMNFNKQGHPYQFPESLIMFLAIIYHAMSVPYRQLEGILRAMKKWVSSLRVPDYTTIAKRVKKMKLPEELLKDTGDGDIVMATDSSGFKVTNRGDWIRKKWKVHRGWLKVHIVVDASKDKAGAHKVLAVEVTDERTGDSQVFDALLDATKKNVGDPKRIKKALLDGAYDSKKIFNRLEKEGIDPVIRVRKSSSVRARGSPKRAEVVREVKTLGYKAWAKKKGYGYRWISESIFSAVKRMYGEVIRAKKWPRMVKEVMFRFLIYNLVITV